ncbi:MAG: AGE family epimerase/isomerase [Aquisalinus sp.]|nr:AGE family epimerase/isomerase [Aquisalinus sp.]
MEQAHKHIIQYHDWLVHDALPYWAEAAINDSGGFHEKLTMEGNPVTDCPRRVRVQARLTQVYSIAARYGWYKNARQVSDHGWHFMTSAGMAGESAMPGIAHLLNPDGSLLDGTRDTYAQAFLLLAAAWRVKAFDDPAAKKVIEQTNNFLNSILRHEKKGWREGYPESLPRRQNPHMHLLEAFMTCYQATGDARYLNLAREIHDLFLDVFFDENTGLLVEYFKDDLTPDKETGHLIEPGHMMEWVWLLDWFDRLTGSQSENLKATLYATAEKIGLNRTTHLLFDQISTSGKKAKATSRLWTLTEYIKASLVTNKIEKADALIGKLHDHYLCVDTNGGWSDTCDAQGNSIAGFMETSSFYHLIGVSTEIHRLGLLDNRPQPS